MKNLLILFFLISFHAQAERVIKIEIGKDYKNHSKEELRQRVWMLEKAVYQLQSRVFQLESGAGNNKTEWICKITAMGNTYTGLGGSRAVAEAHAYENCKKGQKGSNFFCKVPKCTN